MYVSDIKRVNTILVGAKQKMHILTDDTFPANRHSPTGCRLDTSLLSTAQQGAERRSARKVTGRSPCIGARKVDFSLIIWNFRFFCLTLPTVKQMLNPKNDDAYGLREI